MEGRPFVDSLKGMRIGGRYVVEKVLGSGGMGVVATARYPELQQRVAIKFLRPEHASNAILNARFMREARLAARVKSEHFVRVFDIGKLPNGVPYLVMELLTGHDLADELIAHGAMEVEAGLEWVLQALVGLAEIHALGVVHRDLKPSNLFISEAAGKRMVKVLDFGISKENAKSDSGAPLTSTDNLLGTPQYMSPEQVRASKDVDARSDIWSVGVILYELLTARRPFTSDENATGELFAKVLYIDPVKPREHRPSIPVDLEAVIMKCLARDRTERYEDVAALAEALRAFIAPSSALHVDAVKQALASRRSLVPSEPEDEEIDVRPASQLATSSSSPDAKRTSGASSRPPDAAPVTAMTSATGSTERRPRPEKSRAPLFAIGAAVVAIGIGAYTVSSRAPAPAAPLVASSPPPAASSVAAPTSVAAPSGEPAVVPSVVVSVTPPAPSALRTVTAAPPAPRPVAPPRPPPSASSAPPSTGSLIQDRK
ncbi:MAG: protein kinase [Labilithrix sp.]